MDRFEVLAVERGVEKWFLDRDLLGVMAVEKYINIKGRKLHRKIFFFFRKKKKKIIQILIAIVVNI